MPVTSRRLLVRHIEGSRKHVLAPCCTQKKVCKGIFFINGIFGNAICNGTTCSSSSFPALIGQQVQTIIGTSVTVATNVPIFLVNCTSTPVTWSNGYEPPITLQPNTASVNTATVPSGVTQITYTFY